MVHACNYTLVPYIYIINMNVTYILILALIIYDVNPFVGICIGCHYTYTFVITIIF